MDAKSDELIAELRKAISIRKAEVARLKEEFDDSEQRLTLLTSEIAEGRAKMTTNGVRIATLDADKSACIQIEKLNAELVDKFDAMCKEAYATNEEKERQITKLQLEIEAAKDIKSVVKDYEETLEMLRSMRFDNNEDMDETRKGIESAQKELQSLIDEVQAFEVDEKTLSDKLKTVPYHDVPLAAKQEIYCYLKKRKGNLIRKLINTRLSRGRLDSRLMISDL
ncbi:unnamed protein product [Litomosoides sigmodontis]|uniref:Uncharacterized protein n=1 Tax=Litomosoides sigmodontis TaxID=42156 RepID=A0A3P6U576_LITSI|nr:unnamed protein product [Litomosoides sigmodontis]